MSRQFKSKYIAKNPLLLLFLRSVDALLKFKKPAKKIPIVPNLVENVLLCNIAHIGDVIIATCAIDVVKKAYPNAKIGFLTSSGSKKVIEEHPHIDKVFVVDHFKHNRKKISIVQKFWNHWQTARCALKKVRQESYDIAIDLYFFFPNSVYFLYKTRIPTRLAFSSGGYGRLLTHSVAWKEKNQHVVDYYRELFDCLHIDSGFTHVLQSNLPRYPVNIEKKFGLKDYVIFHPGCGAKHKEWQIEKWRHLLKRFESEGKKVVFSGHGNYEYQMINKISPFAYNLCSQLSWPDLIELVRAAQLVVCVDTSIQHIAAALNIPCITLMTGINGAKLFNGNSPKSSTLYVKTLCFRCHRSKGCHSMSCIREVSVDQVVNKSYQLMQDRNTQHI